MNPMPAPAMPPSAATRGFRRPRRGGSALAALVAALALVLAGCNSTAPTPGPTAPPTPARTPTPQPSPQLVKTITFVAQISEPAAASPSGLAWAGVQTAGKEIGAQTSLVQPVSAADAPAALAGAAGTEKAVVVTMGSGSHAAVVAAAAANPAAQFIELDVTPGSTSPANVHDLVFDQAEAGYLAGFVAGAFSASGKVAFAADAATDAASTNYAAGFKAGATLARADATASVGYAGAADAPDKGRTAAAALVKTGADVLVAPTGLSGIGAMREACARGARLVAVDSDAWQTVADVRPCLIGSVVFRYDVAAANAIRSLAGGGTLPAVTVEDVSNGGLGLSEFHAEAPAGFDARLAGVLAALRNSPPRATAAPASAVPSNAAASPSK